MSELTKRKVGGANAAALDVPASPPSDRKAVRAIEYDTRPSCANEPARRYLRYGDQVVPVLQDAPVHPLAQHHASMTTSLRSYAAACCSMTSLIRELKEMFLPAGYPDSVSEDYLTFQFWDTIQAMCSYLRGVLATQSVLQSVGVGDDKATPLAAALQWVLRDGSGMLGGLVFAYMVGPKFDLNVKRWRLFADVINDVGLTLDMLAPFFMSIVTEVLCVSSICKTMCGVAAGATRSSLMTHFAKRDNMADCSAKEGSQETAVKLFGLIFGMYFANAVNASPSSVWIAFFLLTILHVYANYNAVSGLCIPTLNRSRAWILIERYLQERASGKDVKAPVLTSDQFSVRSVNQVEPIFRDPPLPIGRIVMGAQLFQAVPTNDELDRLLELFSDERYLLSVQQQRVHVVFQVDAQPRDELRAYFQSILVLQALALELHASKATSVNAAQVLEVTYRQMQSEFEFFLQQVQSHGWKTHMFLLNTSQWRIKLNEETT